MKKYIIPFLLVVFFSSIALDAEAQRKRRRSSDDKKENTRRDRRGADEESATSFSSKLIYDINIGNISLANSVFGFSIKPGVGYKLNNRLAGGLGLKYFYTLDGRYDPDVHINDYGAFAFAKFKITESIYLQGEYSATSFDDVDRRRRGLEDGRKSIYYPMVGGGYMTGFGNWKSGLQILFIFDEQVRDLSQYPVEFWFGFTRNF